jgi:hypothetical protein
VAGTAGLRDAVLKALCTAVRHFKAPRHLGLLMCLPRMAEFTLRGARMVCKLFCRSVAACYVSTWLALSAASVPGIHCSPYMQH